MSELESYNRHEIHGSLDATDASSFDDLAKGLASGNLSRRKALRMLGAAVVGGALASFPGMAWAAKPAGCPSGVRCKGQCCAVGATCVKGAGGGCACPTGQIVCGGACVTNTCPNPGEAFNPVTCQCECSTGEVLCNGACVSNACSGDTVFDPTTCQCGCPTGQVLCNNACVSNVCEAGQTFNQPTCQCEVITSTCVPGTSPCCTEGPNGGSCFTRADNGEPICVVSGTCEVEDGSGAFVTDCSQCPEGSICTIVPPDFFVGTCGAFFCADTFCPS